MLNRNFQKHLETINTMLSLNADKYIPLSLRAENISFAFERKNEHYFLKPLNDQYMISIANNWDEINFNGTIFDLAEGNEGAFRIEDSLPRGIPFLGGGFTIYSFSTENHSSTEAFYRQLIIKSDIQYTLNKVFEYSCLLGVKTTNSTSIFCGIQFPVDGIEYRIFSTDGLLVVEAASPVGYGEFSVVSRVALLCFGLLTGLVSNGETFYWQDVIGEFDDPDDMAYVHNTNEKYYSDMKVIDTNVTVRLKHIGMPDEEIEEINSEVHPLSADTFGNLVSMAIKYDEIHRALILLKEANVAPFESRAVLYSTILETLTTHIMSGQGVEPPMPKDQAKPMIKELLQVARKYMGQQQVQPIISNIQNCNRPTNRDKLSKPFEILNIPMCAADLKIIELRNKYLHGLDPVEQGEWEKVVHDTMYNNYKLGFYVYALILKLAGHTGRILNLVKVNGTEHEAIIHEEVYRSIGEIYILPLKE